MAKKTVKVNVRSYNRKTPKSNEVIRVKSYDRTQKINQYINPKTKTKANLKPLTPEIRAKDLDPLEFAVLEQIKFQLHHDGEVHLGKLHQAFEEDAQEINDILDVLESKNLINSFVLEPTPNGDRVFWEHVMDIGEMDNYAGLKDFPKRFKSLQVYRNNLQKELNDTYKDNDAQKRTRLEKQVKLISQQMEYQKLNHAKNPLDLYLTHSDWDILSTIREQEVDPSNRILFPRNQYYTQGSKQDRDEIKILDIKEAVDKPLNEVNKKIEYYRQLKIIDPNDLKFTPSGKKNFLHWAKRINYP